MQEQYVLRPEDRINYESSMTALRDIREKLVQNKAWSLYEPSEELLRHVRQKEEERLNPALNHKK